MSYPLSTPYERSRHGNPKHGLFPAVQKGNFTVIEFTIHAVRDRQPIAIDPNPLSQYLPQIDTIKWKH